MDDKVTESEAAGERPSERAMRVSEEKALVLREEGALVPSEANPGAGTLPFAGAGLLNLRQDQKTLLMAPFPDEMHDILPTGEVYIPQIQYRRRLNQIFGPGDWALVPQEAPRQKGQSIVQKWHLIVYGKFVAEAWGEQEYRGDNDRTSEVTAVESAKSNGLVRCCKDLGMGSECWDKSWTEKFKKEFCINVEAPVGRNKELKWVWRRRDGKRFRDERTPNPQAKG